MLDDIARYNQERWEALAQADILYARPYLNLNARSVRELLDPYGVMGGVAAKDVLCLASGGGQQSVAFGLLGANVTVLDLSETQLQRDRQAVGPYKFVTAQPGRLKAANLKIFDKTYGRMELMEKSCQSCRSDQGVVTPTVSHSERMKKYAG